MSLILLQLDSLRKLLGVRPSSPPKKSEQLVCISKTFGLMQGNFGVMMPNVDVAIKCGAPTYRYRMRTTLFAPVPSTDNCVVPSSDAPLCSR
jgi:hypothetical protein